MKIIARDNFDREGYSDILICENVDIAYGKVLVDFLNLKFGGGDALHFFDLVANEYQLYKFKP